MTPIQLMFHVKHRVIEILMMKQLNARVLNNVPRGTIKYSSDYYLY